jgi:nitrite reductase/ring-hydroxylating ferredoxin subunit
MGGWRDLPSAPAPGTALCTLEEIVEAGSKEVVFGRGHDAFRVVLLRSGAGVVAYHNCCPHFSLPLNYEPDVFHVFDGENLMCAHHTAMFRIATGECFDGPCAGAKLTAVPVTVVNGRVVIAYAPAAT